MGSFTLGPFLFSYSKYLNNVEETVGVCASLLELPDCAFFLGLDIPMERHLPRPVLRPPARISKQSSALAILRNHNGDCRRIFLVLYSKGHYPSSEEGGGNRRLVFTSFIKTRTTPTTRFSQYSVVRTSVTVSFWREARDSRR